MTKPERIKGFPVLVLDGKEITMANPRAGDAIPKTNGPHHTATWARDLLGTNISQGEYRRRRNGWLSITN